jgi:hypothetical protein
MARIARSLVVALALGAGACTEATNGAGMISRKIGEAARQPAATEVDLARLTSFGWDRFHVFDSGTPRESICQFVGARPARCGRVIRYTVVPDEHVALVFTLNGRVTHTELHAQDNGEFDLTPGDQGHPKAASHFRVRKSPSSAGPDHILLEPK